MSAHKTIVIETSPTLPSSKEVRMIVNRSKQIFKSAKPVIQFATLRPRLNAFLFDSILSLLMVTSVGQILIGKLSPLIETIILLSLFVIYYVAPQISSWQGTLGQKIHGIKVVNQSYGKLSILQSLIRPIIFGVIFLIPAVGIKIAVFIVLILLFKYSPTSRLHHDYLTGSYVIQDRRCSNLKLSMLTGLIIIMMIPLYKMERQTEKVQALINSTYTAKQPAAEQDQWISYEIENELSLYIPQGLEHYSLGVKAAEHTRVQQGGEKGGVSKVLDVLYRAEPKLTFVVTTIIPEAKTELIDQLYDRSLYQYSSSNILKDEDIEEHLLKGTTLKNKQGVKIRHDIIYDKDTNIFWYYMEQPVDKPNKYNLNAYITTHESAYQFSTVVRSPKEIKDFIKIVNSVSINPGKEVYSWDQINK